MDPYKINHASRPSTEVPPKPDDHSWHGVRPYWTKSFDGAHIADYEEGVTLATEDLDGDQTTNGDAIFAAGVEDRGRAWEAKRDGYTDTIRKAEQD